MANQIREVKTVVIEGGQGPGQAIMIALDFDEPSRLKDLAAEAVDRFKVHRMISPPDTSILLVTIVGDLDVCEFANAWKAKVASDPVLGLFMSQLRLAECVCGTAAGEVLASSSLG